jgi:hypothetical protein
LVAISIVAILFAGSLMFGTFPQTFMNALIYLILLLILILTVHIALETSRGPVRVKKKKEVVRFAREFPRYVISTMMIEEMYNYLVDQDGGPTSEKMCFAYGIVDDETNTVTPCGKLMPDMSERSWASVMGDPRSVHEALSRIDKHLPDHALVLTCHLHPGHGPGSVTPSGTDRKTHRDMERGGYPVIGAIFSQDGYVHFFSVDVKFDLSVTGGGVKEVGKRTFRINS